MFKGEVYAIASGISNQPIDSLEEHTQCRLGKWCHDEGKTKFGTSSAFRNIEEPHKEMHRSGLDALALIASGDKLNAIAHLNKMEAASETLMNCLEKLSANN